MPLLAQADITVSVPAAIGIVVGVVAAMWAALGLMFRLLMTSRDQEHKTLLAEKDRALAELDSVRKSNEEIAEQAVRSAVETTNYYREREGKPPLVIAPPVVSESSSPSTERQRQEARRQTLRATMALITLQTGQRPRLEPPAEA